MATRVETGIVDSGEGGWAEITINPWRSATRHICSVVGCDAPCTSEPFGWRVTHDASGKWLKDAILVEAFFCEQHETDFRRWLK